MKVKSRKNCTCTVLVLSAYPEMLISLDRLDLGVKFTLLAVDIESSRQLVSGLTSIELIATFAFSCIQ